MDRVYFIITLHGVIHEYVVIVRNGIVLKFGWKVWDIKEAVRN
jgi:hypothetical protein